MVLSRYLASQRFCFGKQHKILAGSQRNRPLLQIQFSKTPHWLTWAAGRIRTKSASGVLRLPRRRRSSSREVTSCHSKWAALPYWFLRVWPFREFPYRVELWVTYLILSGTFTGRGAPLTRPAGPSTHRLLLDKHFCLGESPGPWLLILPAVDWVSEHPRGDHGHILGLGLPEIVAEWHARAWGVVRNRACRIFLERSFYFVSPPIFLTLCSYGNYIFSDPESTWISLSSEDLPLLKIPFPFASCFSQGHIGSCLNSLPFWLSDHSFSDVNCLNFFC